MKQLLLIFCLIIFSGPFIYGQVKSKKVDVLWGDEQKESRKATLSDVVGYDETGIYAIKRQNKGLYSLNTTFTLVKYDKKMNESVSVEIDLEEQNKKKSLEFIVQLNKELYLFSSFTNQKLKTNFLFVQSINKHKLTPNNDIKKIAEIDYSGNSKNNSGDFSYELSRDSSKVLIYYNLPYDKGESEQFGFHVYDNNFNQVWEKKVTLPYKEELFDVEDYEVDNDGNVYLLGLMYKDKRKSKRHGEPNYQYQILCYHNNGSEMKEYPIKLEGKFLTDMQIAINEKNEIICGGFYSNEGTYSIIGSYFLKLSGETKEIMTKSFKEFGIDFITQNMTERQEKKTKKKEEKGKDVELFEYDLDNIIIKDDGGAILIGEQFFIRVRTYTTTDSQGRTSTRTVYYYYYNDIIAINMSPEGNIEWTEKIAKRQVTTDDGGFFSSYALAVVGDKLYFVFNDHPENLYYKGEGKLKNFNKGKESLVVLVELDSSGKQTREALFSSKEADILTRPKVCEQISKNEMALYGQRGKTHRFAKLNFK